MYFIVCKLAEGTSHSPLSLIRVKLYYLLNHALHSSSSSSYCCRLHLRHQLCVSVCKHCMHKIGLWVQNKWANNFQNMLNKKAGKLLNIISCKLAKRAEGSPYLGQFKSCPAIFRLQIQTILGSKNFFWLKYGSEWGSTRWRCKDRKATNL